MIGLILVCVGTYYKLLNIWIVLTKILKSFGCKLYQANGKWMIVAVNEFAAAPNICP